MISSDDEFFVIQYMNIPLANLIINEERILLQPTEDGSYIGFI